MPGRVSLGGNFAPWHLSQVGLSATLVVLPGSIRDSRRSPESSSLRHAQCETFFGRRDRFLVFSFGLVSDLGSFQNVCRVDELLRPPV